MASVMDDLFSSIILASVTTGEECPDGVCTILGSMCMESTGQCVCDCGRNLVTVTDTTDNSMKMVCSSGGKKEMI